MNNGKHATGIIIDDVGNTQVTMRISEDVTEADYEKLLYGINGRPQIMDMRSEDVRARLRRAGWIGLLPLAPKYLTRALRLAMKPRDDPTAWAAGGGDSGVYKLQRT